MSDEQDSVRDKRIMEIVDEFDVSVQKARKMADEYYS